MSKDFCQYIKQNKKKICYGFLAVMAIVILFFIKEFISSPYIMNKNGELTGIDITKHKSVAIKIKVSKNGKSLEENAVLSFNKRKNDVSEVAGDDEIFLSNELAKLINSVENSEEMKIILPVKGTNGVVASWSKENNYAPIMLILMFPICVYGFYYSEKAKDKKKEKIYRIKIKRELPNFNNQIILLMNSGLVFSDAFEKIAMSYRAGYDQNEPFAELISDIYKEVLHSAKSVSTVLNEYSLRLRHREFSRLVSIIADHEQKGSDLRGKLMDESKIMWEERKKDAEAAGKLGETKLSFPLGILLIVLIMITAAPAVLEM